MHPQQQQQGAVQAKVIDTIMIVKNQNCLIEYSINNNSIRSQTPSSELKDISIAKTNQNYLITYDGQTVKVYELK